MTSNLTVQDVQKRLLAVALEAVLKEGNTLFHTRGELNASAVYNEVLALTAKLALIGQENEAGYQPAEGPDGSEDEFDQDWEEEQNPTYFTFGSFDEVMDFLAQQRQPDRIPYGHNRQDRRGIPSFLDLMNQVIGQRFEVQLNPPIDAKAALDRNAKHFADMYNSADLSERTKELIRQYEALIVEYNDISVALKANFDQRRAAGVTEEWIVANQNIIWRRERKRQEEIQEKLFHLEQAISDSDPNLMLDMGSTSLL